MQSSWADSIRGRKMEQVLSRPWYPLCAMLERVTDIYYEPCAQGAELICHS